MPHIRINNLKLYYEIYGQGKPLVLIGGYSANTLIWMPVIETFSKHFQCIVFDNRGAGISDVPSGPYSVEEMAADTIGLINALQLNKPHIYGNSLGGSIVQTIAYKYSNEIDRIVIGNSSAKFNAQMLFASQTFLDFYEQRKDLLEQAKLWLPSLFSSKFIENKSNVKTFFANNLANPKPMSFKGMAGQFAALKTFDSRNWLSKINHHCLILSGDEDLTCLTRESLYLHKHIKNSKLHIFEQCGHLPHIEYPELNNKVVLEFLQM